MQQRLVKVLKAATNRGRRSEDARSAAWSCPVQTIVEASVLAAVSMFTWSALPAYSDEPITPPFIQIVNICGTPKINFEEVQSELFATGWTEVEVSQLDEMIAILGDAFVVASRIPTSREQLALVREGQRSGIGASVRRRNSDYFGSVNLAFEDKHEYFANIHWHEVAQQLTCRIASLSLEDVTMVRDAVLQTSDNALSQDLGLATVTNSSSDQGDYLLQFLELNHTILNSELDEPLQAHFGLVFSSRR